MDAAVGQRCIDCVRAEGTQKVIPTGPRRTGRAASPVTVGIIAISAFVYFLELTQVADGLLNEMVQSNVAIAQDGEWWRIFTAALLHSPRSVTHILFNMWALWVLGPQIERAVGTGPYVAVYLAAAGVGGAFYFHLGGPFPAVGASGAIFGLFGIWLNWGLRRRNTMQGRAILSQMGFLLLINAAIPFLLPGIAWEAHLGGLIAGFVVGEAWSRIRGPRTNLYRTLAGVGVALIAVASIL